MTKTSRQTAKASQIDSLAEQIFIQMCVNTHHGYDAAHYVRKAYDFAQAFYQNIDGIKKASISSPPRERQSLT